MMVRTISILAALAATPAAAHLAETPHVHGSDFGALIVGAALIALAGGAALVQTGKRRARNHDHDHDREDTRG